MRTPTVSIITATYNSSHLLRFAIASVLDSDFQDWELQVIGDACTDDTEACVHGFNDPRIRFTNLPVNSGQQATPNNVGVSQATGRYLCFLNQDDMFLPWHLSTMLQQIAETGADILCARAAIVEPFDASSDPVSMQARYGPRTYSPRFGYRASTWFMPLEVARDVGPWRKEADIYMNPSHDWLFRAWRAGTKIVCTERCSVILLNSGSRTDSYRIRRDSEHRFIYEHVVAGGDRLSEIVQSAANKQSEPNPSWRHRMGDLYYATAGRLLTAAGIHPRIPVYMALYGTKRGGFVRYWRRKVGAE